MDVFKAKIATARGVNSSDYYSDTLLEHLLVFLGKTPKIHSLLEIGTGRGYLSIILAKIYPSINRIIATDIDDKAVNLARKNIAINNLQKKVLVKKGNLFNPIKNQKFDLIVSCPPQMPLTRQDVQSLFPRVQRYHLTTSIGGKNGRSIVDKIISNAPKYLLPGGVVCFVHSDIIGVEQSLEELKALQLRARILGSKNKLLAETTLTRLSKQIIERTGYRFRKNDQNQEFFSIYVIVGIYD